MQRGSVIGLRLEESHIGQDDGGVSIIQQRGMDVLFQFITGSAKRGLDQRQFVGIDLEKSQAGHLANVIFIEMEGVGNIRLVIAVWLVHNTDIGFKQDP